MSKIGLKIDVMILSPSLLNWKNFWYSIKVSLISFFIARIDPSIFEVSLKK